VTLFVVVHLQGLDIYDIAISSASNEAIEFDENVQYDQYAEWLEIELVETIPAGTDASIRISYAGVMGDSYRGMFYRSYEDAEGVTKYVFNEGYKKGSRIVFMRHLSKMRFFLL
jgi:hypothetical protein